MARWLPVQGFPSYEVSDGGSVRKGDNSLANLEVITQAENNRHKVRVLGKGIGESAGASKLTENQVLEIRALAKTGMPKKQIGEKFSISRSQIWRIKSFKDWRHLA